MQKVQIKLSKKEFLYQANFWENLHLFMSSRTIFFKNCPTERKHGEKNRLQRGGVWRLYELFFGAKKIVL